MINFPDSPTLDQIFTTAGLSWIWDGVKWTAASGSGGNIFLNAKDYGAVGDGSTDDTMPLKEWLLACVSRSMQGYLPSGTYMVSNLDVDATDDLVISGAPGATIKGLYLPDDDLPVVILDGDTARPKASIRGICFDNSLRVRQTAYGTSCCLSLRNFSRYEVRECCFLATDDFRDDFGDDGITTVSCGSGVIDHCFFRGQPGSGFYISGGGSQTGHTDDYGDQNVTNCYFLHCANAGVYKRQMERTLIHGNKVFECWFGFTNEEADSAGVTIDPGRGGIISNNFFKRMEGRSITARVGPVIVTDNIVEDWGHTRHDVPVAQQAAIVCNASNCIFSNNIMRFHDWDGADQVGIILANYTTTGATGGTVFLPKNNTFDCNVIEGTEIDGDTGGILVGVREYGIGVTNNFGSIRAINVRQIFDKHQPGSTSHFEVIQE